MDDWLQASLKFDKEMNDDSFHHVHDSINEQILEEEEKKIIIHKILITFKKWSEREIIDPFFK